MLKAKILKSARREFECLLIESNETVQAKAKGSLLKKGELVVGDFVFIEKEQDEYIILELLERKNSIFRRIIRENKIKTVASNVDLMAIICTSSLPEYKRGLIDRYLLRAVQWNIPAIVIFNKMDEANTDFNLSFESQRLLPLEVQCFATSAKDLNYKGEYLPGNQELQAFLKAQTIIFLGQSGVGKSSLISMLSGSKIDLKAKELAKVGKGSHTTTWSELIHLDSFDVIDSPGIRTMSLQDVSKDELTTLFPDLEEYFIQCKFKDCHHESNTKGCAFFKDEVSSEVITRLESYQRFKSEIKEIPEWEKN